MKRIYILLLLVINTICLNAQSLYVGLQGGAQYNRLLNKEDARAKANMDILPTYSPVGGLLIGYRFSNQSGIRSIQTGVFFQQVRQKYKGQFELSNPPRFTADVQLNYLHIPLDFTIPLYNMSSRVTPFLSFGGFVNHLIHYKDYLEGYNLYTGAMYFRKTLTGNRYTRVGFADVDMTTDQWLYNRWLFGVSAGLGGEVKLSDALALVFHAKGNYSLNDPENKNKVKYYQGGVFSEEAVMYDLFTAKYFTYLPGVKSGEHRPPTKVLNVGLQVGILYHFSNNVTDGMGYFN